MYKLIDGKVISSAVKERVKNEVADLKAKGITTGLAVQPFRLPRSRRQKRFRKQLDYP